MPFDGSMSAQPTGITMPSIKLLLSRVARADRLDVLPGSAKKPNGFGFKDDEVVVGVWGLVVGVFPVAAVVVGVGWVVLGVL